MKVWYKNKQWELKITLRESLFLELKQIDPTRLEVIKRDERTEVVQICELQTEAERRLT